MLTPLLMLSLTACEPKTSVAPLQSVDLRYVELMSALGVADRDTARNIQNDEARGRKVRAEQERVAFFRDPAVREAIELARASADPAVAHKGELYWRHAVFIRSWTEAEKARETELLAAIEQERNQEVSWSTRDGETELDLGGRWGGVSEPIDDLEAGLRAEAYAAWVEHRTEWLGDDLVALVKLRNEVARREGFDNYWELALAHRGLDVSQVESMLTELEQLVIPLNEGGMSALHTTAEAEGLALTAANEPLLRRRAGLSLDDTQAEGWFDTELAEQTMAVAFTDLGISTEGLQIYVGPSRYTRPGAYSFPIRPPEHAAIVVSNDTRWSMWPYQALFHEVGRSFWWRHLPTDAAASPVLWEPAAPWFEGFGQFFERMLSDADFLAHYVSDMPAEQRSALEAIRRQDTVDTLTWYLGATRIEQQLYQHPGDLKGVAAEGARMEKRLRAWAYEPAVSADGMPCTSFLQSGLMLNYPAYVQNFLFASATEAQLWDTVTADIGDPVRNAGVGRWLDENLVQKVGPERSLATQLDSLASGRTRAQALSAYLNPSP